MDKEIKERIRWQLRRYHRLYKTGGNLATGLSRRDFVRMMIRQDKRKVPQVRADANRTEVIRLVFENQIKSARSFGKAMGH